MSHHIYRDEETGQVKAVNGKLGAVLAWVKVFQPILVILLIPMCLYLFQHEYRHKTLEQKASIGERVYSSTGEAISTNQLRTLWMQDIKELEDRLPPAEYREGVQKQLDKLDEKMDRIVELLLEDRVEAKKR